MVWKILLLGIGLPAVLLAALHGMMTPEEGYQFRSVALGTKEWHYSSDFLADHGLKMANLTTRGGGTSAVVNSAWDEAHDIIIFLHGFPDTSTSFLDQMSELKKKYNVVSPSLRGYLEYTVPGDADMSLYTLAHDVVAITEELRSASDEQTNIHLVGHDWGSAIAQCAARMRPDLFSSIVAMAVPDIKGFTSLSSLLAHPKQIMHSWYMLFFQLPILPEEWLRTGGIAWLHNSWGPHKYGVLHASHLTETFASSRVRKAAVDMYRQNVLQLLLLPLVEPYCSATCRDIMADLAGQHSFDLIELLQRPLKTPMLVLAGTLDRCIIPETVWFVQEADLEKGHSCQFVQDSGHFLHWEQPEKVTSLISDFLQSPSDTDRRWA